MAADVSDWWVTEAWPPTGWTSADPTGIHSHSCFSDGSCVKYNFVAAGLAGVHAINTVIRIAHEHGLLAIYEVTDDAAKDFLVRGGVSTNSIQKNTAIDKPGFTIYTLPPTPVTNSAGLLGYCGEYYDGVTRAVPTDAAFRPVGLTQVTGSWTETFGAPFPSNNSTLGGLGTDVGTYKSFEFVAGAGAVYNLRTYSAQPTALNPTAEPATGMVVTISPCPGDFRAPVSPPPTNDPTLFSTCRRAGVSNNLSYGAAGCLLTAGKTYYMNVTMKGSFQQVTNSGSNTCRGQTYCELNASHGG